MKYVKLKSRGHRRSKFGNSSYFNPFKATNDIICISFQPINEDNTKFDRIKDVDENPGTSLLFNTIIESFI